MTHYNCNMMTNIWQEIIKDILWIKKNIFDCCFLMPKKYRLDNSIVNLIIIIINKKKYIYFDDI